LPIAQPDQRALGIYRWDGLTSRWNFEGGDPVPDQAGVTLKLHRYGRFALLRDESPPVVDEVSPAAGSVGLPRRLPVWAHVSEIGKGLDYDGVSFDLDGVSLESEYDPDRGCSRVLEPPLLAPGRHTLTVIATDRAGNSSAPSVISFLVR